MNKAFEKILESLDEPKFNICRGCTHKEKCNEVQEKINNKEADFCAETMRTIAKEIVQEVAEEYNNGWIPCSERLPDKNGMYLCSQNTYDIVTNKKLIDISTEYVEFYDGKWMRAKNLVVTHWQPLPEPYQPKGE